jgi:hypothetical protein
MKKIFSILALLLVAVSGAWAEDRVVIAQMQNGNITAGEVAASGSVTVTLNVTPAEGYYITADDITVTKTASQAMAPRRAPGYTDKITVSAATVDMTGKGTYTFALPEGYGAYVEAAFTSRLQLTEVTLEKTELTYDTFGKKAQTVGVKSVKAGTVEVPADSYDVQGNTQTDVGNYTVTVTGKGHYQGTATAQFSIVKEQMDIDADDTETGKEVSNVGMEVTVLDPEQKTIIIDNIIIPETAAGEPLTIYIPAEVNGYKVVAIAPGVLGNTENVTDVYLPDTEEPIIIGEGTLPGTAHIHSPLELLDDYALMASLKDNYENLKISATVTPTHKFWTFSSGVDCVMPEGVTAYTVYMDDNMQPRIVVIEEDNLKLADGRRGIKANNGVLVACNNGEGGNAYEIVASPGNQKSGAEPATTDAKSYANNQLEPVIESKNYPAGEYLILKDNKFHSIAANGSKVSACKAVLRIKK